MQRILRVGLLILFIGSLLISASPAHATGDAYVTRYLRVTEPILLTLDEQGNTRFFAADELSIMLVFPLPDDARSPPKVGL